MKYLNSDSYLKVPSPWDLSVQLTIESPPSESQIATSFKTLLWNFSFIRIVFSKVVIMSASVTKSSTKAVHQSQVGDRDKDRDKPIVLRVQYDYEYDYKTRKISITQGETLHLLQKTNQHWWKVVRPGVNKAFFVPAQYVVIIEEIAQLQQQQPLKSSNENNNYTGNVLPSTIKANIAAANSSGPTKIVINRNETSRASHRVHSKSSSSSASSAMKLKNWSASLEELSKQIIFPGITSESVVDLTSLSTGSNNVLSKVSAINKCLSFRNPAYSNNDAKSKESTDHSPHSTADPGEASHNVSGSPNQTGLQQQMKTSENTRPPVPSPSDVATRILHDNWAEYYSDELKRYYYYNSDTKLRSWKPPRNSSRRSDESLSSWRGGASGHGSSMDKSLDNLSETDDACSVSSFGKKAYKSNNTNSNHQPSQNDSKSKESLVAVIARQIDSRNQDCASALAKGAAAAAHPTNSAKHSEGSSSSCTDVGVGTKVAVPDDWQECWDESLSQLCYINKITGARWLTSTDPQGKVYFYEENSSKSSWFLPVPGISLPNQEEQSSESKAAGDGFGDKHDAASSSSTLTLRPETRTPTSVKKRHSTGDVAERFLKSKSMLIPDIKKASGSEVNARNTNSLPRTPISIWKDKGSQEIVREGPLARTKITENGKKVRKNWALVYVVLTEHHLSIFKDQKTFTTSTKSDLEIELEGGVTLDWTEEKSSRKNVFQLNTPLDLQMLFQSDDKENALEWFDCIKSIVEKSDTLDFSLRLRSTESPETLLDVPIGERKISSRLSRNKSTKLKITGSMDDVTGEKKTRKIEIRDHLKKFFHRRPPRESLVKKGIYKDESVFGCSLEKLCMLEKRSVPRFVEECIVAIESKPENLKTDGIYRASGNLSLVQRIRLQVDQHNMAVVFQEEDVHVLAGSLKLFFREMKEPLIPYDLFEKSLQACNLQNNKEKVNKFREIVDSLAKANRYTLQALLKHLLKVAEYSEFNRMQIPNLAIVFGPTLMWPATESTNMALDLMKQNLVIEALLVEFDNIYR